MPADAGRPPASDAGPRAPTRPVAPHVPADVLSLLERLWAAGFGAYVVGGSLRDALLGRVPADWDVATSALPEQVQALFPGSPYENRFGTVGVRHAGAIYEVTTFRRDHLYADHRRPGRVEFATRVEEDLGRRDFTINAMAWGTEAGATPALRDPFEGRADLERRLIRAVGDPAERFEEDALRMLRAIRFAVTLGFAIEPATLAAIRREAPLAATLSGERIFGELQLILAAPRPSVALRLMEATGLLTACLPDLARQRGVPQNKVPGQDLWEHTMATVDAGEAGSTTLRLAALLHDVGKPDTLAEGHFHGHDVEGARLAERMLRTLAVPRHEADRVIHLVRCHMFNYEPSWSDAAVRRFIRRVGAEAVDDLIALRAADNLGSGQPSDAHGLGGLRTRIAAALAAGVPLRLADLALDGDDLRRELALEPGPEIGRLLHELLDLAIADPAANSRERLLTEARRLHIPVTSEAEAGGGR